MCSAHTTFTSGLVKLIKGCCLDADLKSIIRYLLYLEVMGGNFALVERAKMLGQSMREGMSEARSAQKKMPSLRYSYDMLGEGSRTEPDARLHLASYQDAIASIAVSADQTRACEQNDGISIKLSALHPRYEYAQISRVMAELVPRVWSLCQQAAQANINLTIDAEEVERLDLAGSV